MERKVEGFESLIAWQQARVLVRDIYKVSRKGEFAKDYGLKDQIQRASVSIMSNVAEGYERGNRNEFHQFLAIAKASCGEVRSQLYVALDIEYISESDFEKLSQHCRQLSKIISGLKTSIQTQRKQTK
ncbi:four helix bundle protein [uncultured Meiothermus sp.]|uniref:four helix bundle protein n=1 Tax=uncultured Meiothermus sp. TaxID=157471 RepID=UPI00261F53F7|nr:four helix bundle protein [uncultured Meiothermus sp.]